jgi:hypothetical protein
MIPRREKADDGGVHEQYVEESATQPTPVALECELESVHQKGIWRQRRFDMQDIKKDLAFLEEAVSERVAWE